MKMQRKPPMQKFGDKQMLNPKTKRLHRYREKYRRYDYCASPDVADIIAFHQANGKETCIAGILDGLIRAGHRFCSGNAKP